MFNRALWLKHSKQSRLSLILLYLVYLIIIPFSYYNNIFDLKKVDPYLYVGEFSMLAFLGPVLVIILAILLIGIERNTGGIDFQFSLPFTPKQLYLAKWFFGVIHIIMATIGLAILTLLIHFTTTLHQYFSASSFLPIFTTLTLFTIAFFTIALTIGTITGHYFSQVLFSIFTIFSPYILFFSVYSNLRGILNKELFTFLTYEKTINKWSISYQAGNLNIYSQFKLSNIITPSFDYSNLLVILIYIFLFLTIGILCYSRVANENNGKLFVYKKFGKFVNYLFVYLSATLIAVLTVTIADGNNPIVYIIGLLIGTGVGYYFYKRLNKFFE